jgi:hypothetical protein
MHSDSKKCRSSYLVVTIAGTVKMLIADLTPIYSACDNPKVAQHSHSKPPALRLIALSPLVKFFYFSLALFLNSEGFTELGFFQTPKRDRL